MKLASFTAFSLIPGQMYRVKISFGDFDGTPHLAGERWRFVGHNFLPYDDGLTLYVEYLDTETGTASGRSGVIRLRCLPEDQGDIVDRFSDFVEIVETE